MINILDQSAKDTIINRRKIFRLPYTTHEVLNTSLTTLLKSNKSRVWRLPETSFYDEVLHYIKRHKELELSSPRPKLRTSIYNLFSKEQAIKIGTGLNFSALAETADSLIKPILLYYAFSGLCGVYTRAFFNWDKDFHNHGLSCRFVPGDVGKTEVIIRKNGQFPRIATCCFILSGNPSCFSSLVTYSSKPIDHTEPGGLLEKFGLQEVGEPINRLTLDDLYKFNYGSELKKVRERHGFHKFKGLPTTAFLIDYITLFVASSLARYDVLGWKQVLEGEDNPYRIYFENVFERFQTFTIDTLLSFLEDPLSDFDKRLIPSYPSPYSHDDHSRFKKDPNHE